MNESANKFSVPLVDVSNAEPLVVQRAVDDWLRALHGAQGASVSVPGHSHRLNIDVLDSVKAELIAAGAARVCARPNQRSPRSATRASARLRDAAFSVKTEVSDARRLARSLSLVGPPAKSPNIMFLPGAPRHLHDFGPVARELANRGVSVAVGVFDPGSAELADSFGLPVSLARAHSPVFHPLSCGRAWLRLHSLLLKSNGPLQLPRDAAAAVVQFALSVVEQRLVRLLAVADGIGELLDRTAPAVVVVGNPYTMEGRVAARIAAQLLVPTAALQHGTVHMDDPRWRDCPVQVVLAWGEASLDALKSSGLAEGRIRVSGAPRIDEALMHFELADSEPTVLVASSGPGDSVTLAEHIRFIEIVYEAASIARGVRWIVKLHPKDSTTFYENAAARWPNARVDIVKAVMAQHSRDFFDHLAQSWALVTIASTSALDALAADIPVVVVSAGVDTPERDRAFAAVSTWRAASAHDLAAIANELASSSSRPLPSAESRAKTHRYFAHRGSAAGVAAEQLMTMVTMAAKR